MRCLLWKLSYAHRARLFCVPYNRPMLTWREAWNLANRAWERRGLWE